MFIFKNKKQKICQESGHDWDGCVCRRCKAENHEWESMPSNRAQREIIWIWGLTVTKPYSIKRKNLKDIHICKKCGKQLEKQEGDMWYK